MFFSPVIASEYSSSVHLHTSHSHESAKLEWPSNSTVVLAGVALCAVAYAGYKMFTFYRAEVQRREQLIKHMTPYIYCQRNYNFSLDYTVEAAVYDPNILPLLINKADTTSLESRKKEIETLFNDQNIKVALRHSQQEDIPLQHTDTIDDFTTTYTVIEESTGKSIYGYMITQGNNNNFEKGQDIKVPNFFNSRVFLDHDLPNNLITVRFKVPSMEEAFLVQLDIVKKIGLVFTVKVYDYRNEGATRGSLTQYTCEQVAFVNRNMIMHWFNKRPIN